MAVDLEYAKAGVSNTPDLLADATAAVAAAQAAENAAEAAEAAAVAAQAAADASENDAETAAIAAAASASAASTSASNASTSASAASASATAAAASAAAAAGSATLDTDGTLAANADNRVASQKATKTYVDSKVIPSGTWASRPGSPATGQQYFVTDLGSGVMIIYNGSKWKPIGGVAVLCNDTTNYAVAGQGGSVVNTKAFTIPAGLLSATGGIEVYTVWSHTGTNSTKTLQLNHSATSGDTAGGTSLINGTFGASSALSALTYKCLTNDNATNAQVVATASMNGLGNNLSSTNAATTGAVNTANASYLNFNIQGHASDTLGPRHIVIKWIEH